MTTKFDIGRRVWVKPLNRIGTVCGVRVVQYDKTHEDYNVKGCPGAYTVHELVAESDLPGVPDFEVNDWVYDRVIDKAYQVEHLLLCENGKGWAVNKGYFTDGYLPHKIPTPVGIGDTHEGRIVRNRSWQGANPSGGGAWIYELETESPTLLEVAEYVRETLRQRPAVNTRLKGLTDEPKTDALRFALSVLQMAVADYGTPGGPWNMPDEPGTFITLAREAVEKCKNALEEEL